MEKKEMDGKKFSRSIPDKLTVEVIETLPSSIKGWLYAIGAVGHEQINLVSLKQSGSMKLKPEQKRWTVSEAEQISYTDPPAFRWVVKLKMGKGLVVTGKDSFLKGKGNMRIKLAGIIPISKTIDDEKTNESALQRYLMELAWYPSAVLSPFISWEEVDETSAIATMSYEGLTGSVTYFFNEENELLKVEAWRYKDSGEDARPLLCIGTVQEQQVVEGLKVPVKMEITWMLEEGPFTWYRFNVHDIRFNSINGRFY